MPAWARLLEPLYGALVRVRRHAYQRGLLRSGHPGRPVIVIGNLTVGGAGKTPLAIWLLRRLVEQGLAPALVSRGYGGSEPAVPRLVTPCDTAAAAGDEPVLIARDTGVPVWVCRDRLAAARAAVEKGAEVVVADDGLQHLRLQRDFEIVLVDARRGFGNSRLLPAGPLREHVTRLATVDAVICNGAGVCCPDGAVRMELRGDQAVRLDGLERRPVSSFGPGPVHAVAGIGDPERFFASLESRGLRVLRHPLADHGNVPMSWLNPPDGRPVFMTSKDAVRCPREAVAGMNAWEVPVEVHLGSAGDALLARLVSRLGLRQT